MKVNKATIDLIKKHEGLRLTVYKDAVGIPTVGYGNTYYPGGGKVKIGDVITQLQAEEYLRITVENFANQIKGLINVELNENQFGALVSFSYNVGINAFSNSTLRKKININPDDPSIGIEFSRWTKAGGKTLTGLINRRRDEKELYFKEIV